MPTLRTRLTVLATTGALCTVALATNAVSATAATKGAPRCGNSDLAVTRTYFEGGAGHSWITLIYRNTTKHTCSVSGYPGVDAIDKRGRVLAHATRTVSGYGIRGHLGTVKLGPGKYASAGVEWLNFNGRTGGACRYAAALDTVVANTSRVHRVAVAVSTCGLQVHPTVAGTPQYPNFGPAQHYWINGAKVAAADMNRYFAKALQELKAARNYYPVQVKQLTQLNSLPDTGLSAAQLKQAHADVKALDSFFATPGLYS